MPGLVEAHFHPTYFNVAELADLDIKYPVEYVTILAACNARLALECGYTAARSGGSLHNIDVWLKKAIEDDLIPGPRLAASGREICGAGGLMDWNPEHLKLGMEGLILLINGPDEARKAVRKLVKDGVEWIKTYPTGDAAAPDTADHHTLCMTFEEMAAVVAEAHNYRRKVTGHCRATQGIKNALRAGFDSLEHGTFMDGEALDLLLEREYAGRAGPAVRVREHREGPRVRHAAGGGRRPQGDARRRRRERRMILKAGGRLGMGGDYGFAWNPHGDYAKELTFFVQLRRIHAAGNDHLRHQDRRRDHGARPRVRHARAGQAGRRPGRRRRRARRHRDPGGPLAVHRGDAGRGDQGGANGGGGEVVMFVVDWKTVQNSHETGSPSSYSREDTFISSDSVE